MSEVPPSVAAAVREDEAARAAAIDPQHSFIVQAPAGSGKTTLLTQRFLALLATVERPEQVLAITFTRKAAAEMRHRILAALTAARDGAPPRTPAEAVTLRLAAAALAHAATSGVGIESFASRLRIQTIDALNQWLARRLPIASRVGAPLAIKERPEELYREAAHRTLATLETTAPDAEQVAVALLHLDNKAADLEQLLAGMLGRRDHWLRLISRGTASGPLPATLRQRLESALIAMVEGELQLLTRALPTPLAGELVTLAAGAGQRAPPDRPALQLLAGLIALPAAGAADLPAWRGLAQLLLTGNGEWRSQVDTRIGFPKEAVDEKRAFKSLLQSLAGHAEFRERLARVPRLPEPQYSDEQWEVLEALMGLLTLAAGHLEVVFAERGTLDFVGVAAAALAALGSADAPSELALALDYTLRHVLIDEFQDTSATQIRLLELLTAGWSPEDGRTLFCVGDPMQSIYRFREADVALFLRVREAGINQLPLRALQLRQNFRSRPEIVDWVNRVFARVLPPVDDYVRGAVRHAVAVPARSPGAAPAVTEHAFREGDWTGEAQRVVQLVRDARRERADATVGILVRSRRHLLDIALSLQSAGLRFQAVDLVPLGDRSAIRDLAALTRALLHPGDRTAWLSVLRAPWCGLTFPDLEALAGGDRRRTLLDLIQDPERLAALSDDARSRLARRVPLLLRALAERGRRPLASLVATLWYELGGPVTPRDDEDLGNAELFFALLETLERGGDLEDPASLEAELEALFAAPDPAASGSLQLMTIHRAKGLEFDVVILPGLGRGTQGDRSRLLRWLEFETDDGRSRLALAPIKAAAATSEPIESWLRLLEKDRAGLELGRLLYVAATRAREQLHLLLQLRFRETEEGEELMQPAEGTALRALWPALEPSVTALASTLNPAPATEAGRSSALLVPLRRLPATWAAPPADRRLPAIPRAAMLHEERLQPDYDWASETSRHVGTVIHEGLQHLTGASAAPGHAQFLAQMTRRLRELGVPSALLENAADRARRALAAACADDRGRWLLFEDHAAGAAELALTGIDAGQVVSIVIDRTFVARDGVRWIVDYKTSTHEGAGREEFLDSEVVRYRAQLARYARLLEHWPGHAPGTPIRLGLYFPLLGAWREWPHEGS